MAYWAPLLADDRMEFGDIDGVALGIARADGGETQVYRHGIVDLLAAV